MSKKILVTGIMGFLGSHIGDKLLERGYTVIGLDNGITGSEKNIEHNLTNPDFIFIHGDVEEERDVMNIECDLILNAACIASPKFYSLYPCKTVRTCVKGAINLLELSKKNNAKILQFSTSEVVGDPEVHPQPETYNGNVSTVSYPRASYEEGKRCAETIFVAYNKQYNVDTRIARLYNCYGPRLAIGDGRVVSNFVVSAIKNEPLTVFGDGRQTRCLTNYKDTIEGILRLLDVDYHLPVNIGSTDEKSVLEIATIIRDMINPSLDIVFKELPLSDPRLRKPDVTLAKKLIDWNPTVGLETGLEEVISYFRSII